MKMIALAATTILPLVATVQQSSAQSTSCAPREFVEFATIWEMGDFARFLRVDRDGKFVVLSDENAHLIDISARNKPQHTPTRLDRLTALAQGKFNDYLSSSDHEGAMEYVVLSSLKEKPRGALPVLRDPILNKAYHFSAVLNNSENTDPSTEVIRTLVYPPARFRDMTLTYNDKKELIRTQEGEPKKVCTNIEKIIEPSLSTDGSQVSGLVGKTTKIFQLQADGKCEALDDLGFDASKVTFSHPIAGKKGKVAFVGSVINDLDGEIRSRVFVYDRDSKVTYPASAENERAVDLGGFTKDGRLVYQSKIFSDESSENSEQKIGLSLVRVSDLERPCSSPAESTPAQE